MNAHDGYVEPVIERRRRPAWLIALTRPAVQAVAVAIAFLTLVYIQTPQIVQPTAQWNANTD